MSLSQRLKIAYLTATDPKDRHSWSGTHFYIYRALQEDLGDVDLLGPVKPFFALWTGMIATGLSQKLLGKRYNYRHSKLLAKAYARVANKMINAKQYDLIVAPAAVTFIPYLKTNVPIVHIGDTTVVNSRNYHKALSNLFDFSWRETLEIEQMGLRKSSFLVYCSEWASLSAINDYKIPSGKVFTIPFGANLDTPPSRESLLNKKKTNTCNLLFMGVSWINKGGPIAYDAFIELNKMGIDATLTVCGCVPPAELKHEKLKIVPFIDKNVPDGFKQFSALFMQADFFILPTRFEGFGIVFCEASAFGVPSIASNTGGVSSAITEGKNGFLLPPGATGAEYAWLIASVFNDDEKYNKLVRSSRELFESELNWKSWGAEI